MVDLSWLQEQDRPLVGITAIDPSRKASLFKDYAGQRTRGQKHSLRGESREYMAMPGNLSVTLNNGVLFKAMQKLRGGTGALRIALLDFVI